MPNHLKIELCLKKIQTQVVMYIQEMHKIYTVQVRMQPSGIADLQMQEETQRKAGTLHIGIIATGNTGVPMHFQRITLRTQVKLLRDINLWILKNLLLKKQNLIFLPIQA